MWIRGWSVDEFGHLRNVSLEGLNEGLNVVVGPNEAGKTTLLHFHRWVLFGFPPGQSSAVKRYRPGGNAFGGRVQVGYRRDRSSGSDDPAGSLTLERHYGQNLPSLTAADGSALPYTVWTDLVGNAGLELFETVFAITTDELSGFDRLGIDAVREQIYSVGIVGKGRPPREVIGDLDSRRSKLLSPRKGLIRDLLRELSESTARVAEAVEDARNLPSLRADVERLDRNVHEADCERRRRERELEDVRKLLDSWRSWVKARTARSEMEGLPEATDLPREPHAALERATGRIEAATRDHDLAEAEMRRLRTEIDQTPIDESLQPLSASAKACDRTRALAAQRRESISAARVEVEHRTASLEERLSDLGPGWKRETLEAIEVSMPAIRSAADRAETIGGAEAALETARRDLTSRTNACEETDRERRAAQARSVDIRSRLGAIGDVAAARSAATELQGLLPELARATEAARFEHLGRELGVGRPDPRARAWVRPALVAATIVCAITGVFSLIYESPVAAAALGLVAVTLAVIAVLVRRPQPAHHAADIDAGPPTPRYSDSALTERVAACARILDLPDTPSAAAVTDRAACLGQLQVAESNVTDLNEQAELRDRSRAEAEDAVAGAEGALDDLTSDWRTWCAGVRLPGDLAPKDAVRFIERVRHARDAETTLSSAEDELSRLQEDERRDRVEVADLLQRAGMDANGGDVELAVLMERIEADATNWWHRDALDSQLEEQRREHERAATELAEALSQRAELFEGVGAKDPEDYLRILDLEARRNELTTELDTFTMELSSRFGNDAAVEQARARLEEGEVADWEQRAAELSSALEPARKRHEDAVREHQDAGNALGALEGSADVPTATLAVEAARSALAEAVEEWTVATLARRGLSDTLGRFETERQPEVVRTASESFRRITSGHHRAIVPENGSITVITAKEQRLDASALSRGATEQLYLAMRFGLALTHAERNPLPLVLDDVLVNADPDRAEALARELHTVAEHLQVLLFTCHPATAELLSRTGDDTTVVDLAGPDGPR